MYKYTDPHITCLPILTQYSQLFAENQRMCGFDLIIFSKKATFSKKKKGKKAKKNFGGPDHFVNVSPYARNEYNLFYQKFCTGYFVMKQIFRKKEYFWKKL